MSRVLFIQASSRILNPGLDQATIDAAYADDAESARSEWGGLWRSDISEYLPDALIDAAVVTGRTELPFSRGFGYVAFADMSGGVNDAAVLGIAHKEPGTRAEHLVLDQLVIAPAPHEPHEVCAKFAAVLQRFMIRTVTGDRYGSGWVENAFKHHNIRYEPSALDKSAIYMEVVPLFAEKRVELLEIPRLVTELRMLERRPRAGGRGDFVDHAPRSHDDAANAACGALWLASTQRAPPQWNRTRPEYSLV